MTTIQPRLSNNAIRDVRTGFVPAERPGWQNIAPPVDLARDVPAAPDAPLFSQSHVLTTAKTPQASDIFPLASKSPEQQLAIFGRIELLLDRAVTAAGSQRPELELGRTVIAAHVRRLMTLQAGRDGLVGG